LKITIVAQVVFLFYNGKKIADIENVEEEK